MNTQIFLDAHIHVWEFCLFNYFTNLEDVVSLEELVEKLQARPINNTWFIGVRFNQETLKEKCIPEKTFLDRVFGVQPVLIVRTCLHMVVMNTAAMAKLNYYSPNGIFIEADVFAILNTLVKKLKIDPKLIVEKGMAALRAQGITRVIDMGMDIFKRNFFDKIDFYTTDFAILDEALGFKLFLDGGLGVRTAALTEEYTDDRGNYGILNYDDETLQSIVDRVHNSNKPVAVHAVGDRAVDQFIRIIKKSRHSMDRLEHVQVAREEQLDLLAELKVPVCINPIFSREIVWAKYRLGPDRMKTAYAWNLILKKGIPLLAGSDAPVDRVSPLEGARIVHNLEGNQHLDLNKTLEIYAVDNWAFYNWDPADSEI